MTDYVPIELLDPATLPAPWAEIVLHWVRYHPTRIFLPEPEDAATYLLSWDDLRDVLVAGGVLRELELPQ